MGTAFRRAAGILFVDESGQLQAPWDGRPFEFGALGGLSIPDHQVHHEALTQLLRKIRRRLFGDPDSKGEIKAQMLDMDIYDLVAREVRERWILVNPTLPITLETPLEFQRAFEHLLQAGNLNREKLHGDKNLDLRLDFLVRQYREALERYPVYMALLFHLYRETARWFRKNGILPQLKVWLDDKLPRTSQELADFWGRFAIYTEYPEVYGRRLGEVLGVDPSPDFTCQVSSDSEVDGLVIADAIAYATGKVARNDDPGGLYRRALDRMNSEKPW